MSLPTIELIHRLKGTLVDIGVRVGWTGVRVYRKSGDPVDSLWIGYDKVQGEIRVSKTVAEDYLNWLLESPTNTWTVMKWAKENKRRL